MARKTALPRHRAAIPATAAERTAAKRGRGTSAAVRIASGAAYRSGRGAAGGQRRPETQDPYERGGERQGPGGRDQGRGRRHRECQVAPARNVERVEDLD